MKSKITPNTVLPEVELKYTPNIDPKALAKVKTSQEAYNIFLKAWNKDTIQYFEEFKVALLNSNNLVLGITTITQGTTSGILVDVKRILQYAIVTNAASIIAAHNHPSGNIEPSDYDKTITTKLMYGCDAVEVKLLDHLIITPFSSYYSFADKKFLI